MPSANALPSLEYLRECFVLDEAAGHLYWRERPRHHFQTLNGWLSFNGRDAGKRADYRYSNGYYRVRMTIDGKYRIFAAHRIIFKIANGFDPIPLVDHIDRNQANNRPDNLRQASFAQNVENRGLPPRGVASCVYPTKSGKFRAQVSNKHLGTYSTADEARAVAVSYAAQTTP